MKIQLKNQWVECISKIKHHISAQDYDTWFACIEPVKMCKNELVIQVPSQYVVENIEENFLDIFSDAISEVFGADAEVTYKIGEDAQQPTANSQQPGQSNNQQPTANSQQPTANNQFDSQLCSQYTMDSFIEGESNRFARSIGQAIAMNPGKNSAFNPLFIYGPSGCGKTHLANAIGHEVLRYHPELRVLYLSAHLFYVQFANATKLNKVPEFINFYQTIDVLIIDDAHEFSGKTGSQNTFFHIFNHLHMNGKQLILTSDRQPSDIMDLEDRLITRFKWGIQTEIERPDQALRLAVLKHKIKTQNLDIPDSVASYIANNVGESIRDLEGILNSLNAYSKVYDMPVNMRLVDRVLPKFVHIDQTPVSIADIKRIVCRHYNIKETELVSSSRRQPLSQIRQIAIYFASKLTSESTVQIGLSMGGRSHSTVIHSINQIKGLAETDRKLRQDIQRLEEELTH